MKKSILIFNIVVVIIGLGIGGYFYWEKNIKVSSEIKAIEDAEKSAQKITDSATQGVLPGINTNPLENKPEINPVDKTNPFKDIKTNPFE
ncbi:MAG: hypothetical protein ABH951_01340 [Patescibacteria group bacterium]